MVESESAGPILPGATVGIFGGGQLGRMLALAARPMGYYVATYSPEAESPTAQVADWSMQASYEDEEALASFCAAVDVITFEFENVPSGVAEIATTLGVPVRPNGAVLSISQHRGREKSTLQGFGLPVTPFALASSSADLERALAQIGLPAVAKTATFGYDGKGQRLVENFQEAGTVWNDLAGDGGEMVVETFIDLACELSVVVSRTPDGQIATYPVVENRHVNHILDITLAPAAVGPEIADRARSLASTLVEEIGLVGLLCVEFFLTTDGTLLINEIAPRPHNSGHWTIEGAVTSQFEQQLRAVCGLAPGSTEQLRPTVMVNLLGDLWQDGEPNWSALLAEPQAKLHLYGKRDARPGRKMGHVTVTDSTLDQALEIALAARSSLVRRKTTDDERT